MRTYESSEFARLLSANQLAQPMEPVVYGLVKVDENDSAVLLFSWTLSCENWVPIPVSLISSVVHIRNVKCKDHQHPLVKILLVEPDRKHASATLYMQLFVHAGATGMDRRTRALRSGRPREECEVLTFDDVPYICCNGECWIML